MAFSESIALAALPVALGALVWCAVLARRLKAALERSSELERLAQAGDIVGVAEVASRRLDALEEADACRRADDEALASRLSSAIRHVGLVRYDAFDNTAGQQSFSLSMLDDGGDGFVMTSIYGRGEYRMYAKPVEGGRSPYSLTTEETAAIQNARGSAGGKR